MNIIGIEKNIRQSIIAGNAEQAEQVSSLLERYPGSIFVETVFGTWLHVAAEFGHLNVVKHLLKLGLNINKRSGIEGGAPINMAASEGHLEVARYLLACGAEMDSSEPERNPLFSAIYGGHLDVIKLLLDNGADLRVTYHSPRRGGNMDALSFARERGQTAIANYLVARMAFS